MKTLFAVAALVACTAVVASCSSSSSTPTPSAAATSDEDMAREFALSVDGIDFDDLAHPDDFVFGVTQIVRSACSGLDSMSKDGLLPEAPTASSKEAFAGIIQTATRDNNLTEQQQRNKLWVSAKYRCPQYSAALGAHFDAVPVSPPAR